MANDPNKPLAASSQQQPGPVFKDLAGTNPDGWNHFMRDQERYPAGDELKGATKKEKDLLQILNNLPDGLMTMDKAGRVTYFNNAAERITGISAAEALGTHCRQIFKTTTCLIGCPNHNSAQIEKNVYKYHYSLVTFL